MTDWANGENVISARPPTMVIAVTVNVVFSIRVNEVTPVVSASDPVPVSV